MPSRSAAGFSSAVGQAKFCWRLADRDRYRQHRRLLAVHARCLRRRFPGALVAPRRLGLWSPPSASSTACWPGASMDVAIAPGRRWPQHSLARSSSRLAIVQTLATWSGDLVEGRRAPARVCGDDRRRLRRLQCADRSCSAQSAVAVPSALPMRPSCSPSWRHRAVPVAACRRGSVCRRPHRYRRLVRVAACHSAERRLRRP